MKTKLLFLLAICLFAVSAAFGQTRTVKGQVLSDTDGEPLPGVAILEKGTTNGTISDADGNFTLKINEGGSITISYMGYITQTFKVTSNNIKVRLQEDSQLLDDVIVTGYNVQRKSDVTGAVLRVDEKTLTSKPVGNAFEALQGKVSGVDITSAARPGEVGKIRIRGNRSLSASNEPLYVVDGAPLQAGGIETINPNDIASIDILKDASSTAIYGSRGANGVVIITTKSGKAGSGQLNYSGSVTFNNLVEKSKPMSAKDYIQWRRWAYYNSAPNKYPIPESVDGATVDWNALHEADVKTYFTGDDIALANVSKGWVNNNGAWSWDGSKVEDYDWTGIVTRTGITHEHNLSASGGNENVHAYGSFGYLSQEGTQKGQEYERYNMALNVDVQAKPWFKLAASAKMSFSTQEYGYSRTGQATGSGPVDLYSAAKAILRYTLPYKEDGSLIPTPGGSAANTYNVIDEWNKGFDERKTFRVMGNIFGEVNFGKLISSLDGLTYKISLAPDLRHYRRGIFIDQFSAVRQGSNNYVSFDESRHFAWTLDNQINYNKKFGQHNVGLTLLQTASANQTESSYQKQEGIPFPSMKWNKNGVASISNKATKSDMNTGLNENQLTSYMIRATYSGMDRYLLTVSGRWDGSSVLSEGNKWSFFPSAALGWRMEQEDFLKDNEVIEQLKLRVGMGSTGNAAVGSYGTLGKISAEYYMPFSTGEQLILVTNEPYYTSGSNGKPNKNLKWEKTTQFNYGIDFSILKGVIAGTIDFYHSRTTDILMSRSLPPLTGYPSMMDNVGETSNRGVDISINATPVNVGDFSWFTSVNAGFQKDEIVSLANGKQDDKGNNWYIGESMAIYYGYANDGIWKESDQEEIDKFNANGYDFKPGLVRPKDQNGDYKINDDDKVVLGNQNPRFTLGWSNTFSWKGLELNVEMFGRFKYMVNRGGQGQTGMYQQDQISYWTPNNKNSDYQMPIYSQAGGDDYSSLLGFQNASFLKLRNVSLGYNVPSVACKKAHIQGLKVYAQARNLCDIYSTMDDYDLDLGRTYFDRGFTLGVKIDF